MKFCPRHDFRAREGLLMSSRLSQLLLLAVLAPAASGLFLTGCVGTASRVHVDDEPVTDVEASDVDLRAMAKQMASTIIELPMVRDSAKPIRVAFLNIENRTTTVDFDSANLMSKIRQDLIAHSQGKLSFIDKAAMEGILAERDAKRAGNLTSSKRADLLGADYFLTGYAYSQRKVGVDNALQAYHRYSFRLTDAETSEVKWEKDYEFKKVGRRGTVYQGR
jgi:PBP1b-binding outer membrane lipoprotein LpoB